MDLRQLGEPFEKKFTQFAENDLKKVTETYHNWQQIDNNYVDIPEFCYSAKFKEIEKKDFSLVPSKYIEFINRDENIDFDDKMKILQKELKELLIEEEKSKNDLMKVFINLGYKIDL